MSRIEETSEKIVKLLRGTGRPGIESLISYLCESSYFTDPASARYHNNFPGGLAEHSLSDLMTMSKFNKSFNLGLSDESMIIAAIGHDLCKVGTYVISSRNVKNDHGNWVAQASYQNVDSPIGLEHGAISAFILGQFIKLTTEEHIAIVNHMGLWDAGVSTKAYGTACRGVPLAFWLATADQYSTFYLEKTYEEKDIPWN